MKKQKRFISIFCCMCMLSVLMQKNYMLQTVAEEDVTAPYLDTLVMESRDFSIPGEISFSGTAHDDLSAVSQIQITFDNLDDDNDSNNNKYMVMLHSTYYDSRTQSEVTYADGKLHGTFELFEHIPSGKYVPAYIYVTDRANNTRNYSTRSSTHYEAIPEALYEALTFTIENEQGDYEKPVLEEISFNKNSVVAPDTIEITGKASDDVSGIQQIQVDFTLQNEEIDKKYTVVLQSTYWDKNTWQQVKYEDGLCHGSLELDEYAPEGTYVIQYIYVTDNARNTTYYSREATSYSEQLREKERNLSFSVESVQGDYTPPVVDEITVETPSVPVPGTLTVSAKAHDDLAGVKYISVSFQNRSSSDRIYSVYLTNTDNENEFQGSLNLNEFVPAGTYSLILVETEDKGGNRLRLSDVFSSGQRLPENLKGISFTVKNSGIKTGWIKDGTGWWYRREDGSYPVSSFEEIDNSIYYFDNSGYMVTGWQNIGEDSYYFGQNGAMVTSQWVGIYYLKKDGRMAKNEWVDNNKYYVGPDGRWIEGYGQPKWKSDANGWWYDNGDGTYPKGEFKDIDGATYYFKENGYIAIGWTQINGKWYVFNNSGSMKKNAWEGSYWLGEDGVMATDCWVDNNKYYVGSDGKWIEGYGQPKWRNDANGWWFDNGDGTYPHGEFKKIDGIDYYFKENGYMATGWAKVKTNWYCFDGSGRMLKSQWSGNCYLKKDGKMAVSEWVDNKQYYVDQNGYWVPDYGKPKWRSDAGGWWYDNGDGSYPKGEFKDIDGATYYFRANGYMATGWTQIGDRWYFFTGSGVMKKNAWEGNYWLGEDGSMATDAWVDNGRYYVGPDGAWVQNARKQ